MARKGIGEQRMTADLALARCVTGDTAGVAVAIAGFDVQVALVAAHGPGSVYPVDDAQRRTTVVASVSRSF